MPGKRCAKCGNATVFTRGNKAVCSSCGAEYTLPSNSGRGGKGQRCPFCGRYTWFDGRCNACGAKG